MAKEKDMARSDNALVRLRRVIGEVGLDCHCRDRLDHALDRYSTLENARARRARLLEGRQARQNISELVSLLSELDEISAAEKDRSVFQDFADLFRTIATEAAAGSRLMRELEEL